MNFVNDMRKATYEVGNYIVDRTMEVGNSVQETTISLYKSYSSDASFEESIESSSENSSTEEPTKELIKEPEIFSSAPLKGFQSFEFISILSASIKPKVLIVDEDIINPLFKYTLTLEKKKNKFTGEIEKVVEKMFLVTKIFLLNSANIDEKNHHYIYLFRPNYKNIDDLTKIFTGGRTGKTLHDFQKKPTLDGNIHTIYFVSNHDNFMKQNIKNSGYFNRIAHIANFNINIFPIDNKILSMECPKILKRLVDNDLDLNPLQDIFRAISYLERICGVIPNIQDFGENAEKLYELIRKKDEKNFHNKENKSPSIFARITLIDRTTDLITPCLTPSTFEGLIDDILGISCGIIQIEKKWISPEIHEFFKIPKETHESKEISLSLDKKIFSLLKDKKLSSLNEIFSLLKKMLGTTHGEIKNLNELNSLEEKSSVERIGKAYVLATENNESRHFAIAYKDIQNFLIKKHNSSEFQLNLDHEQNILLKKDPQKTLEYIKDLIQNKKPINQVLRLLSLYCQVYGVKPNFLEFISRSMQKSYGGFSQYALKRLEKLGMLTSAGYTQKCSQYHLIESKNEKNPDIFQPYGGYAPLSCRYIEKLLKQPLALPCEGLELIVFIGGCTRAEVSALSLMSKNIVVLTTSLINGNSFMETLLEK